MVEQGIVKVFFGRNSVNKGKFGFVYVLDDDGNKTGEELFFHLRAARELTLDPWNFFVDFSDKKVRNSEPTKGQRITFERGTDDSDRPRVVAWTFKERWDAKEAELTTERMLQWQIVLTGYEAAGLIHFAGTVDETGREETICTVQNGTRQGSLQTARRWTSKELGFYDPYDDNERQGYDSYTYYLQIMLPDGKWLTLRSLDPIPAPYEDDSDYSPDGDDEIDADSLAEIQHGRRLGMYNN